MLGRTQPWDDWDTHYRLFVPSHRHRPVIRPDWLLLIGRCSDWYTVKGEGCSSKNVTLSSNICSSLRHVLDLRPRALHYLCLDLNVKFGIKSPFAPPPSAPECPGISAVQIWNAILRLLFVKCNYLCCEPTANLWEMRRWDVMRDKQQNSRRHKHFTTCELLTLQFVSGATREERGQNISSKQGRVSPTQDPVMCNVHRCTHCTLHAMSLKSEHFEENLEGKVRYCRCLSMDLDYVVHLLLKKILLPPSKTAVSHVWVPELGLELTLHGGLNQGGRWHTFIVLWLLCYFASATQISKSQCKVATALPWHLLFIKQFHSFTWRVKDFEFMPPVSALCIVHWAVQIIGVGLGQERHASPWQT